MRSKDLLGLFDLTAEEIVSLVDEGAKIKALIRKGQKQFNDLAGKSAVTLFYENSTRTRCSFDLAAKIWAQTSSTSALRLPPCRRGRRSSIQVRRSTRNRTIL